jgi:hypothetical protein
VGVLASLGWSRGRILGAYACEILLAGIVVGASSAVLGCLASMGLGFALAGRELWGVKFAGASLPSAAWIAVAVAGVPLALVLGSAPRVLRLAGLPPDAALRRAD